MQVEAKNITKWYGRKKILDKVSFQAQEGECIGLVGANGCGKSTLLSILAGVLRADAGSWMQDQEDLFVKKESANRIGYVPQKNPLFEELTAKDHLRLWYCNSPIDVQENLRSGFLGLLGIQEFLQVPVRKMSGGMKKRLSIGCAIAMQPGILLMDEPGAALDLVCREVIHNYIKEYTKKGGIVILATHEEEEIGLCNRLYLLKEQRLQPLDYDGNIHHLVGKL